MKILVSNDDGIWAEGIRALAATLAQDHEVWVCAPDRERSATGHSMSLHKPLMVSPAKTSDMIANTKAAHMTSGTPADCSKVALGALYQDIKFDLMVSGINHGPNLGIDVLYSGTVSAAMEAMLLGVPSVATSLYSYSSKEFEDAASWVLDFVNNNDLPALIPPKTFININLPPGARADYKGVELTKLGNRAYEENYEERQDPRGNKYFWLAGNPIEGLEVDGTDGFALLNHKVSITPVQFDMTHYDHISELKSQLKL
ncbi:MAG: 5'/3'-nucleotidase SurE [Candidatus Melainabacteria bacterium]|nr:5'/3'-nucleotidase SurE [Candidatus Melainabacteria bacterium]